MSENARGRHVAAATNVLLLLALTAVPVAVYTMLLLGSNDQGIFAVDFQYTLLPAAEKLSHGESPYPAYGYPPLVAFSLVPFAFLPYANAFFVAILLASVPLSLWLLGVRDWRCYSVAFLWSPTFHAVQTANVSLLLLLGFAVCWRYRDTPAAVTVAGGLTIAAKIICWPLALWVAATRRYRGAIGAVAVSLVVTFGLWATLGFSGLVRYPSNLDRLTTVVSTDSYTVKALSNDLGAPIGVGRALEVLLAILVLACCAYAGYRRDDERSFAFAVLATLVASPIVWLHSFVLLLAVVAIFRPRLSGVWLLPIALWLASGLTPDTWQIVLVLVVAGTVFAVCLLTPTRRRGGSDLDRLMHPNPPAATGAAG